MTPEEANRKKSWGDYGPSPLTRLFAQWKEATALSITFGHSHVVLGALAPGQSVTITADVAGNVQGLREKMHEKMEGLPAGRLVSLPDGRNDEHLSDC